MAERLQVALEADYTLLSSPKFKGDDLVSLSIGAYPATTSRQCHYKKKEVVDQYSMRRLSSRRSMASVSSMLSAIDDDDLTTSVTNASANGNHTLRRMASRISLTDLYEGETRMEPRAPFFTVRADWNTKWQKVLIPGINVVHTSLVIVKRRITGAPHVQQLVLTDYPSLFVVDPRTVSVKEVVPWKQDALPFAVVVS